MKGKVEFQKFITREDLFANSDAVYVFGDNMTRTGLGGQARQMRYEPNSIGVPTKWRPSMTDDAFFVDDDFEKIVGTLQEDFEKIKTAIDSGKRVVFPADGLGTGLSQLQQRSPKIYAYIESNIVKLAEYSQT